METAVLLVSMTVYGTQNHIQHSAHKFHLKKKHTMQLI